MKTILKKAFLNLLMIESFLALTSLGLAINLPVPMAGGIPSLFLFILFITCAISIFPALIVSIVSAGLSQYLGSTKKTLDAED